MFVFSKEFNSLWSNLDVKVSNNSPIGGSQISALNLDRESKPKASLLPGCLPLPFDTMTEITHFVASTIGKMYRLRTERLHEFEASWLQISFIL